ncbi:MAG: dCTP deaminase [Candidatus Staskawiczbacteria bacterium RIFCSPHIGHO2_02_FULL_34_9]|uniref:dCTP deaminase, dUMP-forming n=1 Tax=Candidatus Staskawiczbacteria bacterium RIFCSPHIGHO2_02_FULL_34_9 TaxID=1802206 RepID=A0A1G2HZ28_9BACT|nr:MAG: dCTP deaminase [Candidatus Staskawiczbacteria bacterium RIFCSPHIGHO2_02_FULL_34_9]
MILSDKDLKKALEEGHIKIDPLFPDSIQPASIDVHLGADFLVFKNTNDVCIDLKEPVDQMMESLTIDENRQFILHPGEFALGMTYETVAVPEDMVLQLNGKSSLARVGLIVHATAGYVDPGNTLKITLEIYNLANLPIKLYYKMPIAQVAFVKLTSKVDVPYGKDSLNSKYFGSVKPVASQYYKNFLKNNSWLNFNDPKA